MARLLVCRACGTMNRMRDYDGPPEWDVELLDVIDRHMERSKIDRHPDAHPSQLYRVSDADAERLDFESQFMGELSKEQIWIKETRDDMKHDALRCFSQHQRPKGSCPDWHDESKTISRKQGVPAQYRKYLCDLCPVNSYVEFKTRQAAGMYKKQSYD